MGPGVEFYHHLFSSSIILLEYMDRMSTEIQLMTPSESQTNHEKEGATSQSLINITVAVAKIYIFYNSEEIESR